MAATSSSKDKILLKLMVHKEKNKVIFAEADGNFVDTLFSIMTLPMATIVRLLEKCPDQNFPVPGSLKNLYQSLMELSEGYFFNKESKFMMLNPRTSSFVLCRNLKLNVDDTDPPKYFVCENNYCNSYEYRKSDRYFSTSSFANCRYCTRLMNKLVSNSSLCLDPFEFDKFHGDSPGVFVPSLRTFIVTDDLRVMPNTLDFSVRLLRDHGVIDTSQLEERTFDIGRQQMRILVKAALLSKYPLTYLVFRSNIHPIDALVNPKFGTSIPIITINEKDTKLKTMKLKLTLQKSTSKFLFAVADQDFVEFLFGFLEIPLGTLIGKLMNGNTSFECLDNLFASISNMSVNTGIKSLVLKNMLIQPRLVLKYVSENQIFPIDVTKSFVISFQSFAQMALKDPRVDGRFLDSSTKFMLTDDLVITPLSSISGISMLNKFKVSLNDVEQHAVTIDIEKGLKILNASLKSSSTFTDALLEEIIGCRKNDGVHKEVIHLKS